MRKLTLLALVLAAAVLVAGCLPGHKDVSITALDEFWREHFDVSSLIDELKARGFKYGNSVDDISYYTDEAKPPEVFFHDREGNCLDTANFIAEYIEYKARFGKKVAESYQLVLMVDGEPVTQWHYALRILYGETVWWEQSNFEFYILSDSVDPNEKWRQKGFKRFSVVRSWTYK